MHYHDNRFPDTPIFGLIGQFSGSEKAGSIYKSDEGVTMMVASEKMKETQLLKVKQILRELVDLLKQDEKPYTCQILLTTSSPNENTFERVMNNRKIHETMRYLNSVFLGGRQQPIHVKHLHVGPGSEKDEGIIRLPEGLKLKVDHLNIGFYLKKAIDGFDPILLDSTPSLKSISISGYDCQYAIDKPIVMRAEKLVMAYGVDSMRWPHVENRIPNKHVYVKNSYIGIQFYRNLAENWIETQKDIGTLYSFGIPAGKRKIGQQIFEALSGIPTNTIDIIEVPSFRKFPYRIKFSIGETSELVIYGEKSTEPDEHVQQSWVLNFKVQHKQSFKCIN